MYELRRVFRRSALAMFASILIGAAGLSPTNAQAADESADFGAPRWVATWSSPPMAHGSTFSGSRSFENQTVRQIVQISAGGTRMRVRLSNEYGVGSLIIGSAHVAVQATGASIVPASDRTLRFNGQESVVIPEGGVAVSDAVTLNVPSNTRLAISLYVPQNTGFATYHEGGNQTVYVSTPGDFSQAVTLPVLDTASTSRYWLTFVEVLPPRNIKAFAIFGDSISEGATTTLDANRRMSDVLSRWFNPAGLSTVAVLNQSIGCGRMLRDFCGPSGVSRFERDVLNVAGVSKVLLELGFVDIIFPTAANVPEEIVTAQQVIDGLRQLTRRAHARGLAVYIATQQPDGSSTFPNVYTPENEAKRQAVNRWIRTTREIEGVADYDLVLRDPANHIQLRPAYDSGDGVHPNDAGHEAMARAIAFALH
jgi:lysophospholipase L1-like esterase